MNLDHNKQAGTGRTTRMLQHALKRAQQGLPSLILGDCRNGVGSLRHVMDKMLDETSDLKVRMRLGDLISYGTLGEMTRNNNRGVSRFYDYGTHNFKFEVARNTEVLIDHYALERQLARVVLYLRSAAHVDNMDQWLVDTARMMSVMGKRVYLVTENEMILEEGAQVLTGYNVSVEREDQLNNLNLLTLEMVGANPNCVLLVDPSLLLETFGGALREINRWDRRPDLKKLWTSMRDPYLEPALEFAKTHGPCMVVVDTIDGMNKVVEALRPHGSVYRMSASLRSIERRELVEKFENNPDMAYLVVTKYLASASGWRIKRQVSLATTGSLSPNSWAQVVGRIPEATARFINGTDDEKQHQCVQPAHQTTGATTLNQHLREKHSKSEDTGE